MINYHLVDNRPASVQRAYIGFRRTQENIASPIRIMHNVLSLFILSMYNHIMPRSPLG